MISEMKYMKQRFSGQQIFMTAFLLMSISFVGLIDVLSVGPEELESVISYEKAAHRRALEFASLKKNKPTRNLASIDTAKPQIIKDKIMNALFLDAEMKSMVFNCHMNIDHLDSKSDTSYVQLVGQQCGKLKSFEIVNNTNGYTATVFENVVKGFETDLIQLNAGKNEIEVRMENEVGQKITKFIYLHYEKLKNN